MKITNYNPWFSTGIVGGALVGVVAGGDLTGSYPSPMVYGMYGVPFDPTTSPPTTGYVLTAISPSLIGWEPSAGSGDTVGEFGAGFDGGLSILVAGKKQDVRVPFTGTLTGWEVLSQQIGSATFGVGKASYAAFDTFTDMIGAGSPPLVAGVVKNSGSVGAWTTVAVTAGDILRFTLASVSGIQQVIVVLTYSRP